MITKKGESLKGTFASVSEGAISLERKHQSVAVPRAEKSGGDYGKQIVVGMCVIGALVGTLVGSWLGGRGATVYRAK